MAAAAGRAWGWLRSWGSPRSDGRERQKSPGGGWWGLRGWSSWLWGGGQYQEDQSGPVEQYWEAQEKIQPVEDKEAPLTGQRWWSSMLPTSYFWGKKLTATGQRQQEGLRRNVWGCDVDGEFSDYVTPPPSPTPSSSRIPSPFRLFTHSWIVEVHPEHYEICFNFLRHLFDLFVVGFLWTVSPPTKLVLELLGVQGALRLWFHGMAMFLVSTVGMAGLLWMIQEYLPQFALIYGIIQAAVISVSVRQSVMLSVEEEKVEKDGEQRTHETKNSQQQNANTPDKDTDGSN